MAKTVDLRRLKLPTDLEDRARKQKKDMKYLKAQLRLSEKQGEDVSEAMAQLLYGESLIDKVLEGFGGV